MTAPPPTGQTPPRVLLVVAVGVLAVAVPATFVGGWLTGVSWDETYHVMRLTTFLEHGWYLLERDMLGGEPGPWEDQQYVYGPATTLLLHAWSVLWGVEGWGTVSASATAYAVRHLGVTLLSLVGVAATAALAGLGARFEVVAESNQPEVLREMVRLGVGWAVLPPVQAESGAEPLAPARRTPLATRRLVVARRAGAPSDAALDALVAVLD